MSWYDSTLKQKSDAKILIAIDIYIIYNYNYLGYCYGYK